MKKTFLTSTIIFFSIWACGQTTFQETYGGTKAEAAYEVKRTDDGGYIIAGESLSYGAGAGFSDFYLVKVASDGANQWAKTFGTSKTDEGRSVQQTNDGGYVVCGSTSSFGTAPGDCYLVKTSSNGDFQWSKTYGGTNDESATSINLTSDGGYVMTGWTTSFCLGTGDMYVIKTSSDGTPEWLRNYGGTGLEYGESIQQTIDGGYIICGWTKSFGAGGNDVYLVKTASDGALQWAKTYGGTSGDSGRSIQITSDGGFIIAEIGRAHV